MPIAVDRFIKIMSSGLTISPALVASRSGKVDAALAGIAVTRQANKGVFSQGPGRKIRGEPVVDRLAVAVRSITERKAAALALPDDQTRYAALDQIKSDAKSLEKSVKRRVKRFTGYISDASDRMSDPDSDAGQLAETLFERDLDGKQRFLDYTRQVLKGAAYAGVGMAKMKPEEAVALIDYTVRYKDMNKYLNNEVVPDDQEAVRRLELRKRLTIAALEKLPLSPGESKRGDKPFNGIEEFYAADGDTTVTAFYSTGRGFSFGGSYRITVDGISGRDIFGYSALPHEGEVLFLPGTRFHVVSNDASNPAKIKVKLQEI